MANIFALGSNGSGQLGIGHQEDVSVPKQVLFEPQPPLSPVMCRVAAGGNHTLILMESGELFHSKGSVFRPMGIGEESGQTTSGKICSIAATWDASFIVQEDQNGQSSMLYSFGTGLKGELGLGTLPAEILKSPSPTLVPGFPPAGTRIIDIAACMAHIAVVLDNGDVYGWGNGRKGQLGAPNEIVLSPRKVEGIGFRAVKVVCGREFTCVVGDRTSGELVVLGSDKWNIVSAKPSRIPGWQDVGSSWGTIYVLNSNGSLQSWGRNDHGQMVPPGLPSISSIAVGSEHVVCLSEEEEVLSWGWGEHGNCGPQVENGDVKGRWNVIASAKYVPANLRLSGVGAGCATSWINITNR